MRRLIISGCLVLLLAACAASRLSTTEYATRVEALVSAMVADFASLDAAWESRQPDLAGALNYWDRRLEIRHEFLDSISGLDPVDDLVPMHRAALEVFRKVTRADEALAQRVAAFDEVTHHRQWLATPEGEAALAVLEEVYAFCRESQEQFDATGQREQLHDVPWLPPEMKQSVKVAFGCPP